MPGSEPFVEPRKRSVVGTWRSVYLHGEVQDRAGYDVPVLVEGELRYQPEQECVVELLDNMDGEAFSIKCILVAWYRKDGCISGLICSRSDERMLEQARRYRAERRECL